MISQCHSYFKSPFLTCPGPSSRKQFFLCDHVRRIGKKIQRVVFFFQFSWKYNPIFYMVIPLYQQHHVWRSQQHWCKLSVWNDVFKGNLKNKKSNYIFLTGETIKHLLPVWRLRFSHVSSCVASVAEDKSSTSVMSTSTWRSPAGSRRWSMPRSNGHGWRSPQNLWWGHQPTGHRCLWECLRMSPRSVLWTACLIIVVINNNYYLEHDTVNNNTLLFIQYHEKSFYI